jgi:HlyD family secretion protein
MKKIILILSFLALGLGIGGYYYFFQNKKESVKYKTARVEKGNLIFMVSATGIINPLINVQVGTQVSGIIRAIHVDYNSEVKKDQIIAELDPSTFQAQVTQASANLESARASLKNVEADMANISASIENAQANLKSAKANVEKAQVAVKDAEQTLQRRMELFKKSLVSPSERDTAQTAYDSSLAQLKASRAQEDSAEAQLKSARAQYNSALAKREAALAAIKQADASLQMAKVNLEHTIIRSPIDGIVISRSVDVGQTVAASLQAPTLFTIAKDLSQMQVNVSIDESDIGKILVGQQAAFTVSSYPGETFNGKVTQVRNAPITNQNVVTYDTILSADNPGLKLKPGMTATVNIIIHKREGIKKVLNAALNFNPEFATSKEPRANTSTSPSDTRNTNRSTQIAVGAPGRSTPTASQRKVWVLNDGADPQPITTEVGITDGTYTEIKGDSLQEGQEIIVGLEGAKKGSEQSGRPPSFGRFF